jgi:1-acyl-sn-glycerol-3-phosphate acyltransferase
MTSGDGYLGGDMSVYEGRGFLAGAPAGAAAAGGERVSAEQPLWPYTWGRALRFVNAPIDLLYRLSVTRTIVLGGEHLVDLPGHVIFAGTHRSFADLPLIRFALKQTAARRFFNRLVVAAYAGGFQSAGLYAYYSQVAFGIYPLRQYGEREASLRGLAKLAAAGNGVLIFPQGEHTEPEREIAGDAQARFRPGVAHLAAALDAAVVPFGLAGSEKMIPPRLEEYHGPTIANIPVSIKRGPLAVAFGRPLRLEPGEQPHAFAARLQDVCFALARQAEAAYDQASGAPAYAQLLAAHGQAVR